MGKGSGRTHADKIVVWRSFVESGSRMRSVIASSSITSPLSPRISQISIVMIVVCGILSKSLVFTCLLIATQRSFGR